MGSYLRLRQICLAAPHLEASTQLLQSLLVARGNDHLATDAHQSSVP